MAKDFDKLLINGKETKPGKKVKLREKMTANEIEELIRKAREQQKNGGEPQHGKG